MSERKYTLLTGATGLLGQYLMRDLLSRGHDMAVVVRGNKAHTAAERVEQIMQFWESQGATPLRRPVCLQGDITKPNLGLSETDLNWLRKHCDTMLHCAASLVFNEVKGEPYRTNVEGTQNVLDLCTATDIATMHYISTAYVCGRRHDLVKEDEFDVGQEFRNDYEKSKFEAERRVRAHAFDSLTVYRPVVITGDSQTGYTSTYHGTYLYMKVAKVLATHTDPDENGNRHIPVRWGLTGEELRNVTPVDWNSEVICNLIDNPQAHGRTFQLAPTHPITMRQAIEYATTFYNITGIRFEGFGMRVPEIPLNELERWLWANISIYGSYDFMDPEFDWTNLKEFCPEPPCPPIDDDLARRLIQFAEDDLWGKRKKPVVETPAVNLTNFLQERVRGALNSKDRYFVGLEVVGPGGGPWTLEISDDELVGFEPGLPISSEDDVVTISTESLGSLLAGTTVKLQAEAENAAAIETVSEVMFAASADINPNGVSRVDGPERIAPRKDVSAGRAAGDAV